MAVTLKLNLLSISVHDFEASYRFYTRVLGVRPVPSKSSEPDWAILGRSWEVHNKLKAPGMVWELFGGAPPPSPRRQWGRGQGLRPGIQVEDLDAVVAGLRARGVEFSGEIRKQAWGRIVEFIAPEGIHWSLGRARGFPAGRGLRIPRIGWVEIKASDYEGQVAFYREVMGLRPTFHTPQGAMLTQEPGEPVVLLEPGGKVAATDPSYPGSPLRQHPVWISFMTDDVKGAASWLHRHKATILQDVTHHPEWEGVDIVIADVDGNTIQVAQYLAL